MALHLITGYAGQEHITSADQGTYNIATYGDGNFVLNRGNKFAQTILSNNSISIKDGEAMIQGRYIKMASGTTESITIENGSTGKNRNDLICIRYNKSAVDSTEGASFVVIKGTEATGTATDPTYNTGKITDGDATVTDFPLYRVKLNGINIDTVETLFTVKISMLEYMATYQLQPATATTLGGVKVGNGLSINSGTLSVKQASSSEFGGVKIGAESTNLKASSDGTLAVTKLYDFVNNGATYSALSLKENVSIPIGISYVQLKITDASTISKFENNNTVIEGGHVHIGYATTGASFATICGIQHKNIITESDGTKVLLLICAVYNKFDSTFTASVVYLNYMWFKKMTDI